MTDRTGAERVVFAVTHCCNTTGLATTAYRQLALLVFIFCRTPVSSRCCIRLHGGAPWPACYQLNHYALAELNVCFVMHGRLGAMQWDPSLCSVGGGGGLAVHQQPTPTPSPYLLIVCTTSKKKSIQCKCLYAVLHSLMKNMPHCKPHLYNTVMNYRLRCYTSEKLVEMCTVKIESGLWLQIKSSQVRVQVQVQQNGLKSGLLY